MGREAEGHAVWRSETGTVKALLESDALILRGDIRARLPRGGLSGFRVAGVGLACSPKASRWF